MSVFTYNPDLAKAWSSSIVNYLNGGSESIGACSTKFNEQIEKLVQPDVWTGAAASKNYQNFMETHTAMINFINTFGDAFQASMTKVNQNVAELEISNLGVDTNVVANFGTLTYDEIAALSEENINKEYVRYDYATIISIGSALKQIMETLKSVVASLNGKLEELNSGAAIWDGDSAAVAKEELVNIVKTNSDKLFELLETCISNISAAAEAAQIADSAN